MSDVDETGGRAPRFDTAFDDGREAGRRRPAGLGPLGRHCPVCGAEPHRRCRNAHGDLAASASLVHPERRAS